MTASDHTFSFYRKPLDTGGIHKWVNKHLQRYVDEFQHHHNNRPKDTIDQMAGVARGMAGKILPYKKLIEENG